MSVTISPTRLVRESFPILGITLLWAIPAALVEMAPVSDALRVAGIVMALLYAAVRGVQLAGSVPVQAPLGEPEVLLRTNAVALVAAAMWFVLALVADALGGFSGLGGSLVLSPLRGLQFSFAATGVVTVVLYAVVLGVGVVKYRDGGTAHRDPSGTLADD